MRRVRDSCWNIWGLLVMDPCPWTRFKFFDLRMKYLSVGVISDVTPGEQRSAILMESFGCDVQSLLPFGEVWIR
jgi:hypothetical protein